MAGPLKGIRILELAGIGPAPFAGMMLADHGAEVIRLCRVGQAVAGHASADSAPQDILLRSRQTIEVDLQSAEGVAVALDLAASSDGLIEGFRPGVLERLGLGPDRLLSRNPKLVIGRMTGWGQQSPYGQLAGHDINYIAVAGALHAMGRRDQKPTPPMNVVGDFGGGAMMLAFGMVSALLHARTAGVGQVIDCAMTDGAALLMSMAWSFRSVGLWEDRCGTNAIDTGSHFYDSYETADGKFVAIGPIEPKFYAILLDKLGLSDDSLFAAQYDRSRWSELSDRLEAIFRLRTRDQWCDLLMDSDSCFAPVLSLDEAPRHPHNLSRETFIEEAGVMQPAPAPRYSATPADRPRMADGTTSTRQVLEGIGYSQQRIDALLRNAVIG